MVSVCKNKRKGEIVKRILPLVGTMVAFVLGWYLWDLFPLSPTSKMAATEKWDLSDAAEPRNVSKISIYPTDPIFGTVVNYGNGVHYFPHTRADFANTLAKFLNIHTNLEVTAMTGDVVRRTGRYIMSLSSRYDTTDYGAAVGYFVTFREKN